MGSVISVSTDDAFIELDEFTATTGLSFISTIPAVLMVMKVFDVSIAISLIRFNVFKS